MHIYDFCLIFFSYNPILNSFKSFDKCIQKKWNESTEWNPTKRPSVHSGWQKLLQVMKGSRRNPLTQVSSTLMGSFETIFKKMCVRYLTYQLSKNKNSPISAQKIRVISMVHQHFVLPLMVFTDIRCLKNIFINLVTLSIPKVAKNGQKVPILASFEIRLITLAWWTYFESLWLCNVSWTYFWWFWPMKLEKVVKITKIFEVTLILARKLGLLDTFLYIEY